MIEISGRYNRVLVYSDSMDDMAMRYIRLMCASPLLKGAKIRIMPDVSACRGCVIGTTMTINDTVIPSFIGKDGGCGILVCQINVENEIDMFALDRLLKDLCLSKWNKDEHALYPSEEIHQLRFIDKESEETVRAGFCRLGFGNHFIEMNVGERGQYYLVIHSGSSLLGKMFLDHYQERAFRKINFGADAATKSLREEYREAIKDLIFEPRDLEEYSLGYLPHVYCWLDGEDMRDYLSDIEIVQKYAANNRQAILDEIMLTIHATRADCFSCVHNYIDTGRGILHKGSISAQKGERVIISIHMKAGSLLGVGKGNADYNYSAPHGVGKRGYNINLNLAEYIEDMKGIHSATVCEETLGESPRAYKDVSQVIDYVRETVDVTEAIKPIYNFREEKKGNK